MWIFGFWVLTAVTVIPLIVHLWRQRSPKDYCEIIYPVAAYLYIGLGIRGYALCTGLLDSPFHEFYDAVRLDGGVLNEAFILAAIGVAAMYVGYFTASISSRVGRIERWLGYGKTQSRKALLILSSIYGVAALLAACYMFFHVIGGSLRSLFTVTNAVVELSTHGGQYDITGFARLAYTGTFVSAATIMTVSADRGERKLQWLPALIVNLIAVLAWFSVASTKEAIFTIVLGLLIVWNYNRRRIRFRTVAVVGILALVSYPVLFLYRYKGSDALQEAKSESTDISALGLEMFLGRSHHFDMVVLFADQVHNISDLKFGSTLKELAYFYVPRAIWTGKPMSFGYTVNREYAPDEFAPESGGETPSIIGELFLNFYIPGVAVGMFLFGRFLRWIFRFATKGRGQPLILAIYALFVLDAMHMVEGPIASHFATFVVDFIPVWMMGAIASRDTRRLAPRVGAIASTFQ